MEKVVKCTGCGKYFGHSETNTKCPFPACKTEYGKTAAPGEPLSEEREEKPKEKIEPTKNPKKPFKIWKDS